jgi:hypothetical protein
MDGPMGLPKKKVPSPRHKQRQWPGPHGGEKNQELRAPVGKTDSGGDGLTTDAASRYWITSLRQLA